MERVEISNTSVLKIVNEKDECYNEEPFVIKIEGLSEIAIALNRIADALREKNN